MAQDDLEIVRSMCEAYCGGDYPAALGLLDPEVEWHGTVGGLYEGRTFRGLDEVVATLIDGASAWETHTLEAAEFVDAGDKVVVFWHELGRGKESGVEVETETASLYWVEGGKIVRVAPYMDRDEALEAAGLTE